MGENAGNIMTILEEILAIDHSTVQEAPASPKMLAQFQTSLEGCAPPLLVELLGRSNGGEFDFVRFEPSPFLSDSKVDIWSHVQSCYPPSPLIERKEFLPLGNDYGNGLICLNFRTKPASVYLVPYYSESEDEFVFLAPTFEDYLNESLARLKEESRRKVQKVCIPLGGSKDHPLANFGVTFERVELKLVIADEKAASFPNETMLEFYQTPENCLSYTFSESEPSGEKPYGMVNARNELRPGSARVTGPNGSSETLASEVRYLQEVGTYRSYPVWTVVSEEPIGEESVLEIELEFLSSP